MKGVFALVVLSALLAGYGGKETAVSTSTTPSTSTESGSTSTSSTSTSTAPRSPFADVVPEHSLRHIRLIEDDFSEERPRLAESLRAVSGIESEIRCWTKVGWRKLEKIQRLEPNFLLGLADPFTYEIHLHPYVCAWLDVILAGKQPEGDDGLEAAQALIILTHEGTHFTSAGSNEAVVECRAMQNAHLVAARLGIDEEYARRLARAFWEEGYPLMDPYYRSSECRDGGIMDVNSESSDWP